MIDDKLINRVAKHEGFEALPYFCPAGYLTIGYGLNLEAGMDEDLAEVILRYQLEEIEAWCTKVFKKFWDDLDSMRQGVLIEMAFNLGKTGLLKFKRTLSHVERGEYSQAAEEMLRSKWAEQVGARADRLAYIMETGEGA